MANRTAADLIYSANAASRPVISTAASSQLRKVLSIDKWDRDGEWNLASALARATIEHQLEAYNAYKAGTQVTVTQMPSLVDLATELAPDSVEDLLSIPPHIFLRTLSRWHKISYATLRQVLTRISGDSEPPEKRQKTNTDSPIDEWILKHEKYLVDGERRGSEWRWGLVTLKDAASVFPTSQEAKLARSIVRPMNLPGYEVLGGEQHARVDIQPSLAAFKSTFNYMSDGLLKNLNWDNIIVAGGIVLGTLLAVDTPAGKPNPEDQWKSSDIDIYVYGLAPKEANEKLEHLFTTFRANLPPKTPTLVVRNSKTITFYSRYPLRRIQVVLKLVKSPKSVLLNFDLDICAMAWDGTDLWMLPRAARALETGFNVFTMNLIQGHYLSERRASQEQRVFKYASKGYGIRILPSYIASLEVSKAKLDSGEEEDISRGEDLSDLDLEEIARTSRIWTAIVVKECGPSAPIRHVDLENKHQLSSEPQGRSCLTGFSLFMRHVALWEMEHRKQIIIDDRVWASNSYDEEQGVLAYDDTPSYMWDADFNIADFKHQIQAFNLRQITNWTENLDIDLPVDGGPLKNAARLSYATQLSTVLEPNKAISMPVLLPVDFAAFANDIVGQAQADAGLPVQQILVPVFPADEMEPSDSALELFVWRIQKEVMWQQLDRCIDEVFEALYAFHRVNDRVHGDDGVKKTRLVTQLSKRAIRPTVEDEFDAFARWVGRKPIFVDRFYNGSVNLETINYEGGQFTESGEWIEFGADSMTV